MFRSTFTAFCRSFTRHPLYGLLNLLGLSLGIATFIVLSLLFRFETGYETWSPQRERIYAVGTKWGFPGMPDDVLIGSMGGLLEELKANYPQVEGTRDWANGATVHKGADVYSEQIQLVDGNFLTFFGVPLVEGDAATALSNPSSLIISEEKARKYFGTTRVVGRQLTLSDDEGRKAYTISAVVRDLPKNTDFTLNFARLITPQRTAREDEVWHHWGSVQLGTYLKFKDPAQARALEAQMPAFTDRQVGNKFGPDAVPHKLIDLRFVPLSEAHLIDPKLKAAIVSLGLVGVVALGLALINYVNLATARAGLRAKEVAVRKTLGARPGLLRMQFLGEAALTLLLAFLLALSLVELSLPLINTAGGLSLSVNYTTDLVWLVILLGVVMGAGLVAAIYPAFALSAFKPAQVLASSRTPGGGRMGMRLREALAVLQFAAVVCAFVLVLGFTQQIAHIQSADLGFKREGVILINSLRDSTLSEAQRNAYVEAIRSVPGAVTTTSANAIPGDQNTVNNTNVVLPGQPDSANAPTLNWSIVGPGYFDLFGTKLLAGRLFDTRFAGDQKWTGDEDESQVFNVIISRLAVDRLGFATPQAALDKTARFGGRQVRIVGVVDDMRFYNPNEPIPAKLYVFDAHPSYAAVAMVRFSGVKESTMRERLRGVWRRIAPDVPFETSSVADNLDRYYKPERDRSNLFGIGAGVAAFIGCIGLYGMAAFNTSRRLREIGLRKVLGASRGQVVRLLIGQFLRPVAIASVIAWPLAWYALSRWLAQFDDAIAISPLFFVIATAAALIIALGTVGGLALAGASTEPGRALRHE
ncbi:MAG: ABC transporter permease [Asticcacaulis sp.]